MLRSLSFFACLMSLIAHAETLAPRIGGQINVSRADMPIWNSNKAQSPRKELLPPNSYKILDVVAEKPNGYWVRLEHSQKASWLYLFTNGAQAIDGITWDASPVAPAAPPPTIVAPPSERHDVRGTREAAATSVPTLARTPEAADAAATLAEVQAKMRNALGAEFNKLKRAASLSLTQRSQLIAAAEKAFQDDPEKLAFIAMVATALGEGRGTLKNKSDPHDVQGKANHFFTFKLLENRSKVKHLAAHPDNEAAYNKYLLSNASTRLWGAATGHAQFSSWNEKSSGLNAVRDMLLGNNTQSVATQNALNAYNDYKSGHVSYEGYELKGTAATLMVSEDELTGVLPIPYWQLTSKNLNKSGNVGVRVPKARIGLKDPKTGHTQWFGYPVVKHQPVVELSVPAKDRPKWENFQNEN